MKHPNSKDARRVNLAQVVGGAFAFITLLGASSAYAVSCTATGSGFCRTATIGAADHTFVVDITRTRTSCGQWKLRDMRNGVVVKSGGWFFGSQNSTTFVGGLFSVYSLEVDPGAGATCAFPGGWARGTLTP